MKRFKFLMSLAVFFVAMNIAIPHAHAHSMLRKFGRGLLNIATSPLEIFLQPVRVWVIDRSGPAGSFAGIFQGVGFTLGRALAGVYDLFTFPVPIPFRYEPMFQPETVFDGIQWVKEKEWPFPKYGFGRWQERSPIGNRTRRKVSEKSNMIG